MRTINIYVEGKGDVIFISHFIEKLFGFKFDYNKGNTVSVYIEKNNISIKITGLDPLSTHGGIDEKKLKDLEKEIRNTNDVLGKKSIIIVDADTEEHNHPPGGFIKREEYLKELFKETKAVFFIMPNNKDDGNLEELLINIVSDKGKKFHNCLTGYINCLKNLENDDIPQEIIDNPDLRKKKIEWYSYMMLGRYEKKINDFRKENLWNLESEYLFQLKEFLLSEL